MKIGSHHSLKSKIRISKSNKGKNNPQFGKPNTKEQKRKISEKLKGKNNPMFGNPRKDLQRKFIKKGNPNYIDGRKNRTYYCIESQCNNKISYDNWKYGQGRCRSCARKKIKVSKITREKMSKIAKKRKGKKSPRFGKPAPHGNGKYYNNIYMRSSYEIAYAKYLNKNKIKWKYESRTFDLGNMTYTPDFYLPEQDKYIEIKGWWRDNAKIKFKLFRKKNPNIKIKVLMQSDLEKMEII